MKILAADFGDARTGLAICDTRETIATPIGNVSEKGMKRMAEGTARAAAERRAERVVVGLPVNMNGTEGPRAEKCRKFARLLKEMLPDGVSVVMWDERSSTVTAHRYLVECDVHGKKQRERIDPESAAVILESYISYRRNNQTENTREVFIMNKRERVMAAYNGQKPDRVPSAFWYHFPEGYAYGEDAVKAHVEFFRNSGTDLCKVMNDNLCVKDPDINCAADWDKLKFYTMDEDIVKRQVQLVKRVVEEVDHKAVVIATIHGLVACFFHTFGGPNIYDEDGTLIGRHLRENPEGFRHAMEVLSDYIKKLSHLCIEAGADGIYFASLGGERRMFTDEEFAEYIAPYEIDILNDIKDVPCFNVLHMCKGDLNLERYVNYPAKVLNWGVYEGNISLEEGRKLFGEDKVYLGGMDDRDGVFVDGSIEEIKKTAKECVDSFGWKNYILGADCTLPTNIDNERIRAAVEAAVID